MFYLSKQMSIILGCSLLISEKELPSPNIIFSNFQGLETNEFCYIFPNKKNLKILFDIDKF